MKKSISLILLVLISTLGFSQASVSSISVEGSKYHQMSAFGITGGSGDTIITETSNSILTLSVDLPTGTTYSLMIGATVLRTKTTTGSHDTLKIKAIDQSMFPGNSVNNFPYRLAYNSSLPAAIFRIRNTVTIKNLAAVTGSNTVTFTFDTLRYLAYKINNTISKGKYEYDFSQSATPPQNSTTLPTLTVGPVSKSISASGIYYFHIRGYSYYTDPNETNFGLSFTGWRTYSIALTYSAPPQPTVDPVGIKENSIQEFKVYPNPAKDIITVQYTSSNSIDQVTIYNISGSKIESQSVESIGDNNVTFNIESYPAGIYFARIGTGTYKFIKQ